MEKCARQIDLPTLLGTIGKNTKQALLLKDFISMAIQKGYVTKAKDFHNMVYQAVLKLVRRGILKYNEVNKTYRYVAAQSFPCRTVPVPGVTVIVPDPVKRERGRPKGTVSKVKQVYKKTQNDLTVTQIKIIQQFARQFGGIAELVDVLGVLQSIGL